MLPNFYFTMAIVMSARSKIVVAVIVVTFILAAMLVVASTAGWFHNSHQPMPAPHPLQHPYLKVGIPSIGFSLTKNATLNFHLILLVHPSIKCDASEELFYRLKWFFYQFLLLCSAISLPAHNYLRWIRHFYWNRHGL